MANRLTMAQIDAIVTLHKSGHSNSQIARLLEVDRGTVGKHIRQAAAENPQNAPTGSAVADTTSPKTNDAATATPVSPRTAKINQEAGQPPLTNQHPLTCRL